MTKPTILFIKSITPPGDDAAPGAGAVAPIVEKLQELATELQQMAGADGVMGTPDDKPDPGAAGAAAAGDPADDDGDPDLDAGGNGDGAGDDPDAPAGNAAPGATGDMDAVPGGKGTDATDPGAGAAADTGEGGGEAKFGPHNVKPGHHIAFQAGDFKGAGKVGACGADGCTASDSKGREHRIGWHEVTGHNDAAAAAGADDPASKPAPKEGDTK